MRRRRLHFCRGIDRLGLKLNLQAFVVVQTQYELTKYEYLCVKLEIINTNVWFSFVPVLRSRGVVVNGVDRNTAKDDSGLRLEFSAINGILTREIVCRLWSKSLSLSWRGSDEYCAGPVGKFLRLVT